MSGHGSFSAIGSGMKVSQPLDMPKVEELQLGKGKLGALNVEGHKTEVQIADTRLDQTNRLAANLDAMLIRAAKTASAPVDVKAIKDTLVAAGLDKATRKLIEGAALVFARLKFLDVRHGKGLRHLHAASDCAESAVSAHILLLPA